jgi:hypothetical protein
MKIRQLGGRDVLCGRTTDRQADRRMDGRPNNKRIDRRTGMKQLTSSFCNFANAPFKKRSKPTLNGLRIKSNRVLCLTKHSTVVAIITTCFTSQSPCPLSYVPISFINRIIQFVSIAWIQCFYSKLED